MTSPVFDEDKNSWAQMAAIPDLVHTVGTADGTVADVGAAFAQATLNDNFKDLSTKVNGILAALRAAGIIALD